MQCRLTAWQLGGVFNRTYNYDPAGNLVSRSLNSGNQTFSYDEVDRLLTDLGSGSNYTFTYDANGNRLTASVNGLHVQYNYDFNTNRMNSLGGASVLLDAAGNTLLQGKPGHELYPGQSSGYGHKLRSRYWPVHL